MWRRGGLSAVVRCGRPISRARLEAPPPAIGGIPAEGVLIHDVSYQAFVADADGDGDPNDEGAIWVPGETFSDAANGANVTVDSDTGTGYVVTVSRGPRRLFPT